MKLTWKVTTVYQEYIELFCEYDGREYILFFNPPTVQLTLESVEEEKILRDWILDSRMFMTLEEISKIAQEAEQTILNLDK